MKVIVGGPECGKTTVLLHYVYNEIATLIEQANSGTVTAAVAVDGTQEQTASVAGGSPVKKSSGAEEGGGEKGTGGVGGQGQQQQSQDLHALILTSKKKMIESKMIFGIYCEVSIETLREVKLKYIEDYEELVQFLTDFHLLPVKPSVLGIDSLEYFIDNKR